MFGHLGKFWKMVHSEAPPCTLKTNITNLCAFEHKIHENILEKQKIQIN